MITINASITNKITKIADDIIFPTCLVSLPLHDMNVKDTLRYIIRYS